MNSITIYFIRHGQVYNPKKILYGRLPYFKLSDQGKKEIQMLAYKFQKIKISTIFSSPMLRTKQTACIVKGTKNVQIHVSQLLNEVQLFCEGVSTDYYEKYIQKDLYKSENISKGQESIESIAHRMVQFVQKTHRIYRGKKIIAVTHGDPILILKAHTMDIPFDWKYKKDHYPKVGNVLQLEYSNNHYKWI
jgi:broad specificity phosphatase PhoE